MRRLALALALPIVALAGPALASGPQVCTIDRIEHALIVAGKLTQDDIDAGESVDRVRCGDLTGDGVPDALFTVFSGGTAGDTHWGVLHGNEDGTVGVLITYRQGYKVGIARRSSTSFEVLQPHYAGDDPNCCPSSFRLTRYTWTGTGFKASKPRRLKHAPRRFSRQ